MNRLNSKRSNATPATKAAPKSAKKSAPSALISGALSRATRTQPPLAEAAKPAKPAAEPAATRHGVRIVTVDESHAGQRLDNFLLRELKGAPRSLVYRLLRSGELRVNGKRAKPDARVQSGDRLRLPPIRLTTTQTEAPNVEDLSWLLERILHEEKDLLVLDKPSGLASHGGSGLSFGAIEALRALRPNDTLELVHRLDRDTSGVLVFSKKRSTLSFLQAGMRAGSLQKRYITLLKGRIEADRFNVDLPLEKNTLASGERMVRVSDAGKPSQTFFRVIKRFADATLVQAQLGTGRTHQIRVHALSTGHPVAGDDKYGDKDYNRAFKSKGLKRLFLHAASLSYERDGTQHRYEAPMPAELSAVVEYLTAEMSEAKGTK